MQTLKVYFSLNEKDIQIEIIYSTLREPSDANRRMKKVSYQNLF